MAHCTCTACYVPNLIARISVAARNNLNPKNQTSRRSKRIQLPIHIRKPPLSNPRSSSYIDAGWVELKAGSDSRQRIPTITKSGRNTIKLAKQAWKRTQIELQKTIGEQAVRDLHAHLDTALSKLTPLIEEHAHAKK